MRNIESSHAAGLSVALAAVLAIGAVACTSVLGSYELAATPGDAGLPDSSSDAAGNLVGDGGACTKLPLCTSIKDNNCDGTPDLLERACTKGIVICAGVESIPTSPTCRSAGAFQARESCGGNQKEISKYRVLAQDPSPLPATPLLQCSAGNTAVSVEIGSCSGDRTATRIGWVLLPNGSSAATQGLEKLVQVQNSGAVSARAIVAEADAADCNSSGGTIAYGAKK